MQSENKDDKKGKKRKTKTSFISQVVLEVVDSFFTERTSGSRVTSEQRQRLVLNTSQTVTRQETNSPRPSSTDFCSPVPTSAASSAPPDVAWAQDDNSNSFDESFYNQLVLPASTGSSACSSLLWLRQVFQTSDFQAFEQGWSGGLLAPVVDLELICAVVFLGDADSRTQLQHANDCVSYDPDGLEIERYLHMLQAMAQQMQQQQPHQQYRETNDSLRLPVLPLCPSSFTPRSSDTSSYVSNSCSFAENTVVMRADDVQRMHARMESMEKMLSYLVDQISPSRVSVMSRRPSIMAAAPVRRARSDLCADSVVTSVFASRQCYDIDNVMLLMKGSETACPIASEIDLSVILRHCCVVESQQRILQHRGMQIDVSSFHDASELVQKSLNWLVAFASSATAELRSFRNNVRCMAKTLASVVMYTCRDGRCVNVQDEPPFVLRGDVLEGGRDCDFDVIPSQDGIIIQNTVRWVINRFTEVQEINKGKNDRAHRLRKRHLDAD
jgi:hypothetical protein